MRRLLTENDPETFHQAWLESDIVSAFNEDIHSRREPLEVQLR